MQTFPGPVFNRNRKCPCHRETSAGLSQQLTFVQVPMAVQLCMGNISLTLARQERAAALCTLTSGAQEGR